MNSKRIPLLALSLLAAGASMGAAENDTKRHETRVVVGGPGPGAFAETRDPVTYLGVAVAPAGPALAAQLRLPDGQGLVVTLVEPEGPAQLADLRQHDVLTRFDDQILIDPRQLSVLVRNRAEGDQVRISYVRAGAGAETTVTLGKHTPRPGFHWMGEGSPDVLLRTEDFDFSGSLPVVAGGRPPVHVFPHARVLPSPGSNGERVMIFRPRAEVVVADDAGEMIVRVNEAGRVVTAKNQRGEVVFDGPIDTPEQRAALPEDLRQRLEKLEARDVLDLAPAEPGVPALPATGGRRVGGGGVL